MCKTRIDKLQRHIIFRRAPPPSCLTSVTSQPRPKRHNIYDSRIYALARSGGILVTRRWFPGNRWSTILLGHVFQASAVIRSSWRRTAHPRRIRLYMAVETIVRGRLCRRASSEQFSPDTCPLLLYVARQQSVLIAAPSVSALYMASLAADAGSLSYHSLYQRNQWPI